MQDNEAELSALEATARLSVNRDFNSFLRILKARYDDCIRRLVDAVDETQMRQMQGTAREYEAIFKMVADVDADIERIRSRKDTSGRF